MAVKIVNGGKETVMPHRGLIPNKPTVYLDHSHLIEAYEGTKPGSSAGQKRLLKFIYSASKDGNLCLSLNHLLESLGCPSPQEIKERGAWISTLDVVLVKHLQQVEALEIEKFLKSKLCRQKFEVSVFTGSFISLFENLSPHDIASMIRKPDIGEFFSQTAGNEKIRKKLTETRDFSVGMCRTLQTDWLRSKKDGMKIGEIREALQDKFKRGLHLLAKAKAAHLRISKDEGFLVPRNGLFQFPDDQEIDLAINAIKTLESELPALTLLDGYMKGLAEQLAQSEKPNYNSKKFIEAHRGDLADFGHLVGAAYCDIFTCDRKTKSRIIKGRLAIGRLAPLSLDKMGIDSFVQNLEEQLETCFNA